MKKNDKTTKPPKKAPPKEPTTPPAEEPPKRGRKAKSEAPPADAPPPAAPPTPPAPPPPPVAPAASIFDRDDSASWMDGKKTLEQIKHLLSGCPKPKEQPALAFVHLRGDVAVATDERVYQWVRFDAPVSESPLKVTRASVESLEALLDGELKAAAKMESSVTIRWHGLVASIRRTGSEEEHDVLLDRFSAGPDDAAMALECPTFADGSHAIVACERMRNAVAWKGEATMHLFVSAEARQIWLQVDVGGETVARTALAFDGSHLGIRQPSLPMDASGAKPKPAPPPPEKPAPVAEPAAETPVAEVTDLREVVGTIHQIGPGMAWCRVEVAYSAAWERLKVGDINDLSPFVADDVRRVVVWGPYPRERARARLRYLVMRLSALHCEPRLVACDAPDLMARALGAGEPTVVAGRLGDGITDAEFEEAPRGALPAVASGAPEAPEAPAFPTPKDDVQVVLSFSARAFADLGADTLAIFRDFPFLKFSDVGGGERATAPLTPAEVAAVTAILATDGLRCVEVTPAVEGDEESAEEWRVEAIDEVSDAALAPFPTPGERAVVFEVPDAVWATLSTVQVRTLDEVAAAGTPEGVEPWYRLAGTRHSTPLPGHVATLVGESLASWGLRCEQRDADARRGGTEVELWRVGKAGERKGAAL